MRPQIGVLVLATSLGMGAAVVNARGVTSASAVASVDGRANTGALSARALAGIDGEADGGGQRSADGPGASNLGWLSGCWGSEKDGVQTEECWTAVRGGALLGSHSDVKEGRMVSWEFFRVDTTADGTFYFASPQSRTPVPFRMVENTDRKVVFENNAHDFPQRILYWVDEKGALHARVEGPMDGKEASEEWVWNRR